MPKKKILTGVNLLDLAQDICHQKYLEILRKEERPNSDLDDGSINIADFIVDKVADHMVFLSKNSVYAVFSNPAQIKILTSVLLKDITDRINPFTLHDDVMINLASKKVLFKLCSNPEFHDKWFSSIDSYLQVDTVESYGKTLFALKTYQAEWRNGKSYKSNIKTIELDVNPTRLPDVLYQNFKRMLQDSGDNLPDFELIFTAYNCSTSTAPYRLTADATGEFEEPPKAVAMILGLFGFFMMFTVFRYREGGKNGLGIFKGKYVYDDKEYDSLRFVESKNKEDIYAILLSNNFKDIDYLFNPSRGLYYGMLITKGELMETSEELEEMKEENDIDEEIEEINDHSMNAVRIAKDLMHDMSSPIYNIVYKRIVPMIMFRSKDIINSLINHGILDDLTIYMDRASNPKNCWDDSANSSSITSNDEEYEFLDVDMNQNIFPAEDCYSKINKISGKHILESLEEYSSNFVYDPLNEFLDERMKDEDSTRYSTIKLYLFFRNLYMTIALTLMCTHFYEFFRFDHIFSELKIKGLSREEMIDKYTSGHFGYVIEYDEEFLLGFIEEEYDDSLFNWIIKDPLELSKDIYDALDKI